MHLDSVVIKNFRSIKELTIRTTPACQVLVGINESGKTNILDAIALRKNESEKSDVRIPQDDEGPIKESYVKFVFNLDDEDREMIKNSLELSIYSNDKVLMEDSKLKELTLSKINELSSVSLLVDVKEGERYFLRIYDGEYQKTKVAGLGKIKKDYTAAIVKDKGGSAVSVKSYKFFDLNQFEENIQSTVFEDCSGRDIEGHILEKIIEMEKVASNVVYWKYDEKGILPPDVVIENFEKDPNSCLPLKTMFMLGGYENIEKEMDELRSQGVVHYENALNKIGRESTKYLRRVWKEYKDVSFYLKTNGDRLEIRIKDKVNTYSNDQRSDGFKRFISFLLNLSGRVYNNQVKDSIILIDEPEIGLHISGQKYLMEELIRMSKNNLVFYSTHSIFMVDRKEPSRHFIIKKHDETTTSEQVSESNITDDEVIFNALGSSSFEILREKNIIFEGWSDKKVFTQRVGIRDKIQNNAGLIHSTGVTHILCLAKMIELAKKKHIVISDSDEASLSAKKKYENDENCREWIDYGSICPGAYTLEDFIKHAAYSKILLSVEKKYGLSKFNMDEFKEIENKRVDFIKKWIQSNKKEADTINNIMKEIKSELYNELEKKDIEQRYDQILNQIREKVDEMDGWT